MKKLKSMLTEIQNLCREKSFDKALGIIDNVESEMRQWREPLSDEQKRMKFYFFFAKGNVFNHKGAYSNPFLTFLKGYYANALESYLSAENVWKSLSTITPEDEKDYFDLLSNTGALYLHMNSEKAHDPLCAAADYYEKLIETPQGVNFKSNYARILCNLGRYFAEIDRDYTEAQYWQLQAVKVYQQLCERDGAYTNQLAWAYHQLGCSSHLGNKTEHAVSCLKISLSLRMKMIEQNKELVPVLAQDIQRTASFLKELDKENEEFYSKLLASLE